MTVKFRLDASKLSINQWLNGFEVQKRYGAGRYADAIRDQMRKDYESVVGKTEYGKKSVIGGMEDGRSLSHAIVRRGVGSDYNTYEIGAKDGNLRSGNTLKSYDDIFSIIESGVPKREPWTFKLQDSRQGASEDGYWTVSSLAPRPFRQDTLKKFQWGTATQTRAINETMIPALNKVLTK